MAEITGVDRVWLRLYSEPRELVGGVLRAIENIVDLNVGDAAEQITTDWYQRASVVNYDLSGGGAAYLGAYGPRSILKIEEAFVALLARISDFPERAIIVDYGCGPSPAYAALCHVYELWRTESGHNFAFDYIGVDRCSEMLKAGGEFGTAIQSVFDRPGTFAQASTMPSRADVLLVANVMNEGEGVSDPVDFLRDLLTHIEAEYIILLEPATEFPARTLCALHSAIGTASLGPCPHAHSECSAWSFREFAKRRYNVERRCLGERAAAATFAKYSLALLARTKTDHRDDSMVHSRRLPSGRGSVCSAGQQRWSNLDFGVAGYDLVNGSGSVVTWWPL